MLSRIGKRDFRRTRLEITSLEERVKETPDRFGGIDKKKKFQKFEND